MRSAASQDRAREAWAEPAGAVPPAALADAAGRRPAAARPDHPVQTIAVAGGKGGSGKSNVAVNLATALGAAGREVLLLDGDLALGNVDRLLGLAPTANAGTSR